MKKLLLLFSMVLSVAVANAQMPDGSVVPNFTTTDLNGNTIELYDLLDQGYVVAIDVFATWCGPCWNYHNTHALADFYDQYGPNGTNEVYVLGVEGDPSTTVDEIYGIGSSTWGDWTDGVPYPIVDDAAVADLLQISYYPTIYFICQNRIIREAGQIGASPMYALKDDCAQPFGMNNAAILSYSGFEGSTCDEVSFAPSVVMQNLGTETMTSADVDLTVDGSVMETINWTGTLEPFQTVNLNFGSISVGGGSNVSVDITSVNGVADEDTANNLWSTTIDAPAELNTVTATLNFLTDSYGYETYWAVLDDAGQIIAEGGNTAVGLNGGGAQNQPSGGYGNNTLYTETVELPANGCYELVVVDDWGDGMCCAYGTGYYRMTDENGTVLFEGGEFESNVTDVFEEVAIVDNVTAVETLSAFEVFPNPTAANATIKMTLTEATDITVQLVDVTGTTVRTLSQSMLTAGTHVLPLDLNGVAAGMYTVVAKTDNNVSVKRVVKQ